MSDPVTNIEIEDVLSSIRRLVSDGDRTRDLPSAPTTGARDNTAPLKADEAAQTGEADRFILTPALMVVDAPAQIEKGTDEGWSTSPAAKHVHESEPAQTEKNPENKDAAQAAETAVPFTLTERIFEPEDQEVSETKAEREPDAVSDVQTEAHQSPQSKESGDAPTNSEHGEVATSENDAPAPQATAGDRSNLVATIAELEAAVGTDADEFEPDGSEVNRPSFGWPLPNPNASPPIPQAKLDVVIDAQLVADTRRALANDADLDQTRTPPSRPEPEAASAPVEDPRALDAHPAGQVKEDKSPEKLRTAILSNPVLPDEVEEDAFNDALDEAEVAPLDEEALRTLVAEVVREELSGPMGERITRNVRKLVRREIYRILSSKEFD